MIETGIDSRYEEKNGVPLFPNANTLASDEDMFQGLDKDWVKNAFMIGDDDLVFADDGNFYAKNRYWSSAGNKFTDSRLGGNIGINPRPQFTRYADIRTKGLLSSKRSDVSVGATMGNHGMGRYYSESIDDPAQIIYLRFGVPQYNSLTRFFTSAFDGVASRVVKTGRYPVMYKAAQVAGSIAIFAAFPLAVLTIMGIKTINRYFGSSSNKYYTIKPTMHMYWGAVNTLVDALAVNAGIVPKLFADNVDTAQAIGRPYTLDTDYLTALADMMPDVFPGYTSDKNEKVPGPLFDIYAIANRAQRMANYLFVQEYDALTKASRTDFTGYVQKKMTGKGEVIKDYMNADANPDTTFFSALDRFILGSDLYKDSPNQSDSIEFNPRNSDPKAGDFEKFRNSFFQYFQSEIRDGAQYASFRVDHTGPMAESFSNVTMESSVSEKINQAASTARSAQFSFLGGNIDDGVVGQTVGAAVSAVGDVLSGFASGVTMGFSDQIAAILTGAGYVDIPKTWQNSNAQLPKSNYTISLVSPYGNALSIIQNIYIPLCMLLAGALPRSTGKNSYGPPFLCQLYDKGRSQIRLGMIENLSITRGTTNLGFNLKGIPLGIDVSFSVVDLSSIMHMPMSSGGILDNNATIDEDNILLDYLAVLAGQDINSQSYAMPVALNRAAKDFLSAGRLTSPAYWASNVNDVMANNFPLNALHWGLSAVAADSRVSTRLSSSR